MDYSLFYIRREREERKAGRSKEAALNAAAATSGRTVLVSGLTVMAAMAGLYFAGDAEFAGLATGSIIVVAMAMLGSITVLPAMLSKVGDGVDRGRIPFLGKRMQRRTESRVWSADPAPRDAAPAGRRRARHRPPGRAVDPGARHAHRVVGHRAAARRRRS